MKNLKRSSGFTLIELLVVIAIIGFLSAIVLAALNSARGKGADAAVKANLINARSQAELYYVANANSYSGVCTTTAVGGVKTANDTVTAAAAQTGATVNIVATTAGAYNKATCHDSASAWMAEAPLKASASGSPVMWCVDNTAQASGRETSNVAASIYVCP